MPQDSTHYQARIVAELPSRDPATGAPALTLNATDTNYMIGIWPDYQDRNLMDPHAAIRGPFLQYLHVKRATVEYLQGQTWQDVTTEADGEQRSQSDYGKLLSGIYKVVCDQIDSIMKELAGSSAGFAVGQLLTTTLRPAIPGFVDPNDSAFLGDPLKPSLSRRYGW
jgi:hypothetical protein